MAFRSESVKKNEVRRKPRQRRARLAVESMLDAVVRIAKREGIHAITTNRIADVAGVSIGSVYQYFRDKRSIFISLHRRHIEEIDRLIEKTLLENAAAPLDDLLRAMVEAMIDAHTADPELHEMLFSQIPHRAEGTKDFALRVHGAFRLAISSRARAINARELDRIVFVVTNMVDALCHAAALRRPTGLSLAAAKEEAVRAVLAYIHSHKL
jgi:AcrR family transcriptional regulator